MGNNNYEEREIDLLDIIWSLLEQWRAILVVGLIFAVLLPLCIGVKSVSGGGSGSKEAGAISAKEYKTMVFALSLYTQYKTLEDEYTDGVLNDSSKELDGKAKEYSEEFAAYNTAITSLSEDTRTFFFEFIKTLDDEAIRNCDISSIRKTLDEAIETKQANVESDASGNTVLSGFSKKYIAIGFMAGIFLYAMIVTVLIVFSKKVKSAGDVESMIGVRHYGNVYKYPYKGVLSRFCHSSAIYHWRKKSAESAKIADDLATKLNFLGDNQVTMVSLGEAGDISSVIEEQSAVLKSKGIEPKVINIPGAISDMKDSDFLNLGTVFVQVISGKTTFKSLVDLRNKLAEYDVKLIGTEFIEVN